MKNVPHLFAKATVIYCIAFATLSSLYALCKQGQGFAMSEVLAIVLAFFGGELLLLCLKTILAGQQRNDSPADRAADARSRKENTDDEDPAQ